MVCFIIWRQHSFSIKCKTNVHFPGRANDVCVVQNCIARMIFVHPLVGIAWLLCSLVSTAINLFSLVLIRFKTCCLLHFACHSATSNYSVNPFFPLAFSWKLSWQMLIPKKILLTLLDQDNQMKFFKGAFNARHFNFAHTQMRSMHNNWVLKW